MSLDSELNDAMEFASEVDDCLEKLGTNVYSFSEQSNWSEGYKRNVAKGQWNIYKKKAEKLIKKINEKYQNVEFAINRKTQLQSELKRFEKVVLVYVERK
jgi:hypothetical protein